MLIKHLERIQWNNVTRVDYNSLNTTDLANKSMHVHRLAKIIDLIFLPKEFRTRTYLDLLPQVPR